MDGVCQVCDGAGIRMVPRGVKGQLDRVIKMPTECATCSGTGRRP